MSDTTIQDAGEKLGGAVKDDWAGRSVAEKKTRAEPMRKRRPQRQRPPLPKRPRLERLQRTGPQVRDTEHVTPGELIEMFSIRGVEFGNWMKPDERQASVDLCYDALWDLAGVLGLDPHMIGRARLGIGFGSRGRGKQGAVAAAAHYEPNRVVINLTRFAGDGSLAHEMGHMFEHSLTGFEFKPDTGAGRRRRKHRSFASSAWVGYWKEGEQRPELIAGPVGAAFLRCLDVIMKAEPDKPGPWRSTNYHRQARSLGKYWEAPLEMFARAFEAYVYDWLAERSRVSQYLVHGVEGDRFATGFRGNPYPIGEERLRINAVMADLIEVWRDTLF
jgi:hypothetical protein